MRTVLSRALLLAFLFAAGCSAVRDDVARAQSAYDAARFEDARVWLDARADDVPLMDRRLSARFHYLRGMTAYRLSDRPNALHDLALARELAGDRGLGLSEEQRRILERTLDELQPQGRTHRPPAPAAEDEATVRGDSRGSL